MNAFRLKMIAIITMLIDHIGALLYRYNLISPDVNTLMRGIGRIAFPIFAFLIANGWYYTKNRRKYVLMMLLFAIISHVPYALAITHDPQSGSYNFFQFNVMFSFVFAMYGMYLYENISKNIKKPKYLFMYLFMLLPFIVYFIKLPPILPFKSDYGIFGIIMVVLLYVLRDHRDKIKIYRLPVFAIIMAWAFFYYNQDGAITEKELIYIGIISVSGFLCALYNDLKGRDIYKYIFYIFYPAHLLILGIISMILA